jgi:hypothetical protein
VVARQPRSRFPVERRRPALPRRVARRRQRHRAAPSDGPPAHPSSTAAASRHTVLETPRLLLTAAYLVEADRVAEFREQVDALASEHRNLGFACTGPWPPYNFSRIELDGPTA